MSLEIKARIIKSTGSWYKAISQENLTPIECRLTGKFRIEGHTSTNPIAVGDWVQLTLSKETNEWVINRLYPRQNYISRKSVNLSKQKHIIASNIDQLFLIVTLKNPCTSYEFIDRFLVGAESFKIPTHIVFNKIDLLNTIEEKELLKTYSDIYQNIGYSVWYTEFEKEISIPLKNIMQGQTTLISGHSGVGKSTCLKQLFPNIKIVVGALSSTKQLGKNTTTFAEMYPMSSNTFVIDTPGIRGFGLTDDFYAGEVGHYFVDLFNYAKKCKFSNCQHLEEPNCAIKKAVYTNEIAISRYQSYVSILDDLKNNKYRYKVF